MGNKSNRSGELRVVRFDEVIQSAFAALACVWVHWGDRRHNIHSKMAWVMCLLTEQ